MIFKRKITENNAQALTKLSSETKKIRNAIVIYIVFSVHTNLPLVSFRLTSAPARRRFSVTVALDSSGREQVEMRCSADVLCS